MGAVFVSYRREDTRGETGRLTKDLERFLADGQIFRDIDAIEPGVDFAKSIESAIAACQALVVVIGPDWLGTAGRDGRRRLEEPSDYVRIEVGASLKRDIRVIPVLVGDAQMPTADQLPDDLKALATRQAHDISETRWDYDVERLASALTAIPGVEARPQGPTTAERRALAATPSVRRFGRFAGASFLAFMGVLFVLAGLMEAQALAFFWAAVFLGGAYFLFRGSVRR